MRKETVGTWIREGVCKAQKTVTLGLARGLGSGAASQQEEWAWGLDHRGPSSPRLGELFSQVALPQCILNCSCISQQCKCKYKKK